MKAALSSTARTTNCSPCAATTRGCGGHQSGGFIAPDIVATETATDEPPDEPMPGETRVEPMPEPGKDDVPVVTRA